MRTPTEALKEIRDRLTYFCLRTDGRYDPPWATELVGIIDESATGSHAVGNAAAMREALESVHNWCINKLGGASFQVTVEGLLQIVDKALSAPARNCDKFADAESARQAWLDDAENWDEFGSPKLELHEWLLAPTTDKSSAVGDAAATCNGMTIDEAITHAEDVANASYTPCARQHRQLADWLKELRDVKRMPVGNSAAMREALSDIIDKIDTWRSEGSMEHWQYSQLFDIADAALSAPARQCDVGTPEEQSERMEKSVCSKHHGCVRCPLRKAKYSDCSLGWAQTPYEAQEGGAE